MPPSRDPVIQAKMTANQDKALELRLAGYDLKVIAEQCGYQHPSGADYAIKQALKRQPASPPEKLRELESARLDRLIRTLWPRALRGDLLVIDRVLNIMVRRARLWGLDKPPEPLNINVFIQDYAKTMAEETGLDEAELVRLAGLIAAGRA